MWTAFDMRASSDRSKSFDLLRQKNSISHGFRDGLRDTREGGLAASIEHPASPLLRLHEAGATEQPHVVRGRGLREADRGLDVAGAEAALVGRNEVAAGLPARAQEVQDLQARRVPQSPEDEGEVG